VILVDTSVWVDFFNGFRIWQTDFLHAALGRETVLMGDLILMEVLQGFRSQRDFLTARQHLSLLECHSLCSSQLVLNFSTFSTFSTFFYNLQLTTHSHPDPIDIA